MADSCRLQRPEPLNQTAFYSFANEESASAQEECSSTMKHEADQGYGWLGSRLTHRYAATEFLQKNFSATAVPLLEKYSRTK